MSVKESLASNYVFFRYPAHHILIIIPVFISTIQFFLFNSSFEFDRSTDTLNTVFLEQNELVDNYLLVMKLTMVIFLSFFVTFRWSSIIIDGTYGYWITQGVLRRRLLFLTLRKFVIDLFIAELLGLFVIIIVGGIRYKLLDLILLIILIFANIYMIVVFALLTANIVKNPEFAALAYILFLGVISVLEISSSSIWFKLLQSDLQYQDDLAFIWFFLSIIFSSITLIITIRLNQAKDIEL